MLMALHGTLVCDSENWCIYYKLGLFTVVCFIHVSDQTLANQQYCDKGPSVLTCCTRCIITKVLDK